MLHFFRRFQQYIFIVVTIVIIISFSFFGTYSGMQSNQPKDPVAFTAIDGTKVKKSELDQLVYFIGSDAEEKSIFGGVWGPNFLNDGVIKKNFLETGILENLAEEFPNEISDELQPRLKREKLFNLYRHPQSSFISTEGVWKYFLPGMNESYASLKTSQNPLSPEAFLARVKLFLGERQFPAPYLRQMLLMQENQYNWIEHDPSLDYNDLSLFGYHKAEDWFGRNLMYLAAEFIINSAIIAQEHGYKVTKEEALADLIHNASLSFTQNKKSPQVNVSNVSQYLSEQLRRMGLDKNTAAKLWQQVMLFRRLFNEMGNSVFVDPLIFKQYHHYAFEGSRGQLYQLPAEFRLGDSEALKNFEVYLDSISPKPKDKLSLPKEFKPISEIEQSTPQLLQKRYLVEVSEVSAKDLEAKVGLKAMWKWQTQDDHWKQILAKFPELAATKSNTPQERLQALDALDDATRAKINSLTRSAIVSSHPEWIEQALESATPKTLIATIPLQGGEIFIKGNKDRKKLIALLDQAPLGESAQNPLKNYSEDQINFYQISVLDRSPAPEIMTFAEANQTKVLAPLVNQKLKAYYEKIKTKYPKLFQNNDQTWKNYDDVSDQVFNLYYDNGAKEIESYYTATVLPKEDGKNFSLNRAASLRLFKHAMDAKSQYHAAQEKESTPSDENDGNQLPERKPLEHQWNFVAKPFEITKSSPNNAIDKNTALALKENEWSQILVPPNGDLSFFQVTDKSVDTSEKVLNNQVNTLQRLLGNEAQKNLSRKLISIMQSKGALNLEHLTTPKEEQ